MMRRLKREMGDKYKKYFVYMYEILNKIKNILKSRCSQVEINFKYMGNFYLKITWQFFKSHSPALESW